MENNLLLRNKRLTSPVVLFTGHVCYFNGLSGGTEEEMREMFLWMGMMVFLAVVCYYASIVLLAYSMVKKSLKTVLGSCYIFSIYWVVTYDRGSSFLHHGEY